jgi:hypothetical protein
VFDVDIDPNSTAFLASHPEQLHKLPQDYNAFGDYIRANQLLQNGSINFDDFVSGELFEDAIQDEDLLDPHDADYFEFWMSDGDYSHQQTIARCMYASREIICDSKELQAYELDITKSTIINGMQSRNQTPSDIGYKSMQPYFSWITTDLIKGTFKNSTQYGFMPSSDCGNLFKRWKSPNPAMNVFCLQDNLLTDKISTQHTSH